MTGSLAFVLAALVLIWGAWRPVHISLPDDLVPVATAAELSALPAGRTALLSGTVHLSTPASSATWLERFAYVHRERRDLTGSGGKHTAVVTIAESRPALVFDWPGGRLSVPAGTYDLALAPIVHTDKADSSSTGFRPGDRALALVAPSADGPPRVTALLEAPLSAVAARLGWKNRIRFIITLAAKIILSVFSVSLLLPVRPPRRHAANA